MSKITHFGTQNDIQNLSKIDLGVLWRSWGRSRSLLGSLFEALGSLLDVLGLLLGAWGRSWMSLGCPLEVLGSIIRVGEEK